MGPAPVADSKSPAPPRPPMVTWPSTTNPQAQRNAGLRRVLDRLQAARDSKQELSDTDGQEGARAGEGDGMAPVSGWRTLPQEIVQEILRLTPLPVIRKPSDSWRPTADANALREFGRLRSVSATFKTELESSHPEIAGAFASAIARYLMERPKLVHRAATSAALATARRLSLNIDFMVAVSRVNTLLAHTQALEELDVSAWGPALLAPAPQLNVGLPQLKKLRMHRFGPPLTADSIALHTLCPNLVSLEILSRGQDGPPALWPSEQLQPRLQELRLDYVDLSPSCVRYLCSGSPFTRLSLSSAELSSADLGLLMRHHGPRLDTLALVHMKLESDALAVLDLATNTILKHLDLSSSSPCSKPIDPPFLHLATNRRLKTLNLSRHPLLSLSFNLDTNTSLRHLTLSNLDLASETRSSGELDVRHLEHLGAQLAMNGTLRVLEMEGCGLRNEGVKALRLGDNSGLREVNLRRNEITPDVLSEMQLEFNGALERIDLRENPVQTWGSREDEWKVAAKTHSTARRRIETGSLDEAAAAK